MNFKYWITEDRALIVLTKGSISYNKVKSDELQSCFYCLHQMKIPEELVRIDFCNIKKINFDDRKKRIVIFYDKKEKLTIKVSEKILLDEIRTELVTKGPRYKNSIKIKEKKNSINKISYLPAGVVSLLSFNLFWFFGVVICTLMITILTFYRFQQSIKPCDLIEEFKYSGFQDKMNNQPISFL